MERRAGWSVGGRKGGPVYVAYFTAWPDSAGKVAYFDDVYGRESRLMDAMASTDTVRSPNS